jgi:hypothetical protein
MAKRAVRSAPVKLVGKPLPSDWRTSTWQVAPMMAKIPPSDYEAVALDFEAAQCRSGALSDDWPRMWRAWCRDILVGRRTVPRPRAVVDLPPESLFD